MPSFAGGLNQGLNQGFANLLQLLMYQSQQQRAQQQLKAQQDQQKIANTLALLKLASGGGSIGLGAGTQPGSQTYALGKGLPQVHFDPYTALNQQQALNLLGQLGYQSQQQPTLPSQKVQPTLPSALTKPPAPQQQPPISYEVTPQDILRDPEVQSYISTPMAPQDRQLKIAERIDAIKTEKRAIARLNLAERYFNLSEKTRMTPAQRLEYAKNLGINAAEVEREYKPIEVGARLRIGAFQNSIDVTTALMKDFTPEERASYVGAGGLRYKINQLTQLYADVQNKKADPKFARFAALNAMARAEAFDRGGKQLTPFEASIVFGYVPTGREPSAIAYETKLKLANDRSKIYLNRELDFATAPRSKLKQLLQGQSSILPPEWSPSYVDQGSKLDAESAAILQQLKDDYNLIPPEGVNIDAWIEQQLANPTGNQ